MRVGLGARKQVEQIADIAERYGHVEVRARCFSIPTGAGTRYELWLESGQLRAIVDVSVSADLPEVVRHAMVVFAESMAARV